MTIKSKRVNWARIKKGFKSLLSGHSKYTEPKTQTVCDEETNPLNEVESSSGNVKSRLAHSGTVENNPYLQSRMLWQDIYGSAEARYRQSRRLNGRLMGLVALCILGVIYIGLQSKFVPYVVQVQDGQVIYVGAASRSNFGAMKPTLAKFFIQDFIRSSRAISVDGYIEKNNQKKSFALTMGAATTELAQFYKDRNPYELVKKRSIGLKINYVNQLPNHAFQIGWTELSKDSSTGHVLYQKQYVGEFDYTWQAPSHNTFILKSNPFGFYVTNISWTQVN